MRSDWTPGRLDDKRDASAFDVGESVIHVDMIRTVLQKKFEWSEYCSDPSWMYKLSGYDNWLAADIFSRS